MALFRKFFYRKPPDGLLEISERVYVFDSCFSTDILEDNEYRIYMGGIVAQLRDQFPDASFMVFNFREGENQSQIATILSEYDMTVMDYPRQYEGCPLLTMEMIHHFMRSGESWLSLGQHNLLLMHCERGGWPVLAFMLAALLVYRKQHPGEQKTLEMIYKQAPHELLQLLSPVNPVPSQLRYLQYISKRNVGSEWPPQNRTLTLDCIIIRLIPDFDGEGGCRPIFRIYGQDLLIASDRTTKVLFSTPKKSKLVRLYKQADGELVKIDINCHIQGDVVLECISVDEELEREEMMFRVMFNTAFIRSNILMLNHDSIDMLWDAKDRFSKDFRVEILLSEMDAATSVCTVDFPNNEEKEGLPVEAFAKVQEIFNDCDWLETKGDVPVKVLREKASSNVLEEMIDGVSPRIADGMQDISSPDVPQDVASFNDFQEKIDNVSLQKIECDTRQAKSSTNLPQKNVLQNEAGGETKTLSSISHASSKDSFPRPKNIQIHEWQAPIQRSTQLKIVPQHITAARSSPSFSSFSLSGSAGPVSRYHSAPSALGITALLHDHASLMKSEVAHSTKISPTNISNSTISAFGTISPLRPSLQLQSPGQSSSIVSKEEILLSPPQEASSLPPSVNTTSITTTKGADSTRTANLSNVSFKPPQSSMHTKTESATCSIPEEVPTLASRMLPPSVHDTPSYFLPSIPERFSAAPGSSEVPTINQQALSNKSHMSVPVPPPPPPLKASSRTPHPPQPSGKIIDRASTVPPAPPPPPSQPLMISSSPSSAPYKLKMTANTASVFPSPSLPPPALLVSSNLGHFPLTLRKETNAAREIQRPPPPPPPSPPQSLMATSNSKCPPTKMIVSTTSVLSAPPPSPHPPDHPSQSTKKAIDTPNYPTPPTPPPLRLTTSSSSTNSLKPIKKKICTSNIPPAPAPPCQAPLSKNAPLAPPPPQISSEHTDGPTSKISFVPPAPPPHLTSNPLKGSSAASSHSTSEAKENEVVVPPPPPKGMNAPVMAKCQARTGVPQKTQSAQPSSRKANLKPLHWVKVTRAVQGSLWAETQKSDELSKAPEFDMSELESLFAAAVPNSEPRGSTEKSSGRLASSKPDKIHLIDLRRANNCEIMLTKVKIPLSDLLSSVLALDDTLLDADQIDNLIKFCPTKEEMELLKGYIGDKEILGKCEQYFLELMKVPRVESKLRVFCFKIQFRSQVSDLSNNLNIVNSAAEEIRSSIKLKRIMQTILSLGNALNQGTARGSAIGFRLDSLLKLTDTRARNNKVTLMHYLCKILADKLPELLDFPKDLISLEIAAKIQLKTLAEEMQAISKGLEKVEQELIASQSDGPISQSFCKTLKEFLTIAEDEVRALTSRYSSVGRNADALALYFGEDPVRCPFEQVVSTLLNFVKMFVRAHEENCRHLELEKKKAQKEAENDKMRLSNSKEQSSFLLSPKHASTK